MVFTILGFPKDVRQVYFGENGVFEGLKKGSLIVDMTTTEPALSEEIFEQAKSIGASSVDAPVSGGDIGARAGKLLVRSCHCLN